MTKSANKAMDFVMVRHMDLETLAKLWSHARSRPKIKSPVALWTKWTAGDKWRDILHEIEKGDK